MKLKLKLIRFWIINKLLSDKEKININTILDSAVPELIKNINEQNRFIRTAPYLDSSLHKKYLESFVEVSWIRNVIIK
jgi:hypothetical protein